MSELGETIWQASPDDRLTGRARTRLPGLRETPPAPGVAARVALHISTIRLAARSRFAGLVTAGVRLRPPPARQVPDGIVAGIRAGLMGLPTVCRPPHQQPSARMTSERRGVGIVDLPWA
ncbi:MAG: hypothetical protein ACFBRM_12845 [Pikeienuella sp.]